MALGEVSLFWDKPDEVLTPEELEYYQYSGQDLASFFECMYTTGITPQMAVSSKEDNPSDYIGSSLAATAGNGLQVGISPGTAMIKGRPYIASLPIKFDVAEGAITDILLQSNAQQEKPEIKVIARIRPTGATLVQNMKRESLIYEIAVATVDVPSASIQITPIMLTDQRLNTALHSADNKPLSGLCQSIPKVNTLGVWEDYQVLDAYIKATWRTFIAESTDEWAVFLSTKRSEFDVWFDTLQDILSDDVAAKLATQILEVDSKVTKTTADLTTHISSALHTFPLAHSKSGTTHNLTGTLPTTGIVQASFKAAADYSDGDSITVNGEAYALTQGSFRANIPAAILLDVEDRTVTIGGSGGGGGKLFNTIKIPASGKYDLAGGKWLEEDIPSGVGFYTQSAVLGTNAYLSHLTNQLVIRNLIDNSHSIKIVTYPSGYGQMGAINYNDELYIYGFKNSVNYFALFKVDIVAFTVSLVYTGTTQIATTANWKMLQVTATRFLLFTPGQVFYYDFANDSFALLVSAGMTFANTGYALQKLNDGNYLIAIGGRGDAMPNLDISKYFTASNTITKNTGTITFPNIVNTLQTFQLGEKLMFTIHNSSQQAGNNTGELDLISKTVDPTKFPNYPSSAALTAANTSSGFIHQNNLIYYGGAKKYYLPLIQSPPEQNAVVAKIYKGQSFNTPFDTVEMSAIPNQSEFTVSPKTSKATQDISIHLGQYEHIGELPINVWEE